MDFDYFDLLTIRAALVFTQEESDGLDLESVIEKVDKKIEDMD